MKSTCGYIYMYTLTKLNIINQLNVSNPVFVQVLSKENGWLHLVLQLAKPTCMAVALVLLYWQNDLSNPNRHSKLLLQKLGYSSQNGITYITNIHHNWLNNQSHIQMNLARAQAKALLKLIVSLTKMPTKRFHCLSTIYLC